MKEVSLNIRFRRGSYAYRVRFTDEMGKAHEKSQGGFKRERDAKNAGRSIVRKLEDGLKINHYYTIKNFGEFFRKTYKKGKVEYETEHSYEVAFNLLNEEYGKLHLEKFNSVMYQTFINKALETHELSTVRTYHTKYRSLFKRAVKLNLIDEDPTEDAVIKKIENPNEKKEKKMILEYEELPAFIKSVMQEDLMYQVLFILALNSGMRIGELAALTWDDIGHLDDKDKLAEINISKSAFRQRNEGNKVKGPKTNSGFRVIELDKITTSYIRKWKKEQEKQNFEYGVRTPLVFTASDHRSYLVKQTVHKRLQQVCERAKIEQISIHKLRHTHCVMEIDSGADWEYVRKRLGHKNVTVTMNVYHHCSNHIAKASFSKYNEFMGQIWGKSPVNL
ncbi:site-specific integrase [Sporolactobacillus pectinivorans]|uniref:site-specific integrase n=1 Tax=Sporolactobacillus pectinivorans TaxID=1591408 RepID=UPI000C264F46|nr:site-specific integrase [Sporolactobacillus pectinivorans]